MLGRISDKIGRKLILLLSVFGSMISFISPLSLTNFYFFFYLGYLLEWNHRENRTKGLGKIGAASRAGIIVDPAIGVFLDVYSF